MITGKFYKTGSDFPLLQKYEMRKQNGILYNVDQNWNLRNDLNYRVSLTYSSRFLDFKLLTCLLF